MKIRNPILLFLISFFIILNLADVITTHFIIAGESNPLYLMFGTLWPVYFLKVLLVVFVIFTYVNNKYKSVYSYFTLLVILLYGNIALGLAQYVNIYAIMNPAVLQAAAEATANAKVQSYVVVMNVVYLIPALLTLVTFWLYERSVGSITLRLKKRKLIPWRKDR